MTTYYRCKSFGTLRIDSPDPRDHEIWDRGFAEVGFRPCSYLRYLFNRVVSRVLMLGHGVHQVYVHKEHIHEKAQEESPPVVPRDGNHS